MTMADTGGQTSHHHQVMGASYHCHHQIMCNISNVHAYINQSDFEIQLPGQ